MEHGDRPGDGRLGLDRGRLRSWYLDASGRNSTLWPGFTLAFTRKANDFRPEDHRVLDPVPERGAA